MKFYKLQFTSSKRGKQKSVGLWKKVIKKITPLFLMELFCGR